MIREADKVIKIPLAEGHSVVAYSFGAGDDVILCANGGPGLPCTYIKDSHSIMAERGFRVVIWDQLGCGASDRPNDPKLWCVERYVEEMEQVRRALNLGKVHFLGHSWGCDMGIEYALKYQTHLKSMTLANGTCNTPHAMRELNRLRAALGPETVSMMQRHEAEGTLDHPEYEAAITLLNYRHVCRLNEWPDILDASLSDWNMGPYETIQGPNEFTYTGNSKDWNRTQDLYRIDIPVLVISGLFDEMTPACSAEIHNALPNAQICILQNSSHMPFFEEPEAYFDTLAAFLEGCCR